MFSIGTEIRVPCPKEDLLKVYVSFWDRDIGDTVCRPIEKKFSYSQEIEKVRAMLGLASLLVDYKIEAESEEEALARILNVEVDKASCLLDPFKPILVPSWSNISYYSKVEGYYIRDDGDIFSIIPASKEELRELV